VLEKRGVEAQTIPLLSKMIIASGRGSLLVTSGWADTLEKGKGVAFDELVGWLSHPLSGRKTILHIRVCGFKKLKFKPNQTKPNVL
jgi:hypothetical protein